MIEIYLALAFGSLGATMAAFSLWRVLTLPTNAALKRSFDELVEHVDGMATTLNSMRRAGASLEEDVAAQLEQITGRLARVKQRESNEKRRNGGAPESHELTEDEQFAQLEASLWAK